MRPINVTKCKQTKIEITSVSLPTATMHSRRQIVVLESRELGSVCLSLSGISIPFLLMFKRRNKINMLSATTV